MIERNTKSGLGVIILVVTCVFSLQSIAQETEDNGSLRLPREISAIEYLGEDLVGGNRFLVVGDNENNVNRYYEFTLQKDFFEGKESIPVELKSEKTQDGDGKVLSNSHGRFAKDLEATGLAEKMVVGLGEQSERGSVAVVGGKRLYAEYDARNIMVQSRTDKKKQDTIEGLDIVGNHVAILAEGGFQKIGNSWQYQTPQLFVHSLGVNQKYVLPKSTYNNPIDQGRETIRVRGTSVLFAMYDAPSSQQSLPVAIMMIHDKDDFARKWLYVVSLAQKKPVLIRKPIPLESLMKSSKEEHVKLNWEGMCWFGENEIVLVNDGGWDDKTKKEESPTFLMKLNLEGLKLHRPDDRNFRPAVNLEESDGVISPTPTDDYKIIQQRLHTLVGASGKGGALLAAQENYKKYKESVKSESDLIEIEAWETALAGAIDEKVTTYAAQIETYRRAVSAVNFDSVADNENGVKTLEFLVHINSKVLKIADSIRDHDDLEIVHKVDVNGSDVDVRVPLKATQWFQAGVRYSQLLQQLELLEGLLKPKEKTLSNKQLSTYRSEVAGFWKKYEDLKNSFENKFHARLFEIYCIHQQIVQMILTRYSGSVYEQKAGLVNILDIATDHRTSCDPVTGICDSSAAQDFLVQKATNGSVGCLIIKVLEDSKSYESFKTNERKVRSAYRLLARVAAEHHDPGVRSIVISAMSKILISQIDFSDDSIDLLSSKQEQAALILGSIDVLLKKNLKQSSRNKLISMRTEVLKKLYP